MVLPRRCVYFLIFSGTLGMPSIPSAIDRHVYSICVPRTSLFVFLFGLGLGVPFASISIGDTILIQPIDGGLLTGLHISWPGLISLDP